MSMPEVEVALALGSGYTTPIASMSWTVVDSYVEGGARLKIDRGRQDNEGQVQPSRLSLTLDNRDGRFTPEYASGAYYPNIKKGVPVRVRVRWVVGSGTWYTRFLGYVDEWPVEWPGGGSSTSTVTINATSRMARLGKTAAFKSIVEEEILYDGPVLYFPLGEPTGSTTAGNIAPGRSEILTATQVGSGGTLEFGAGIGPGTDDLTAPMLTPVNTSNGLYLRADLITSLPDSGDTILDLECFFIAPVSATQGLLRLVGKDPSGSSTASFNVLLFSDHVRVVAGTGPPPTFYFSQTDGAVEPLTDGLLHHVSARAVYSGTEVTSSLVIDGAARETGTTVPYIGTPVFTTLYVAGESVLTGTIAHATVYSNSVAVADARIVEHYHAGLDGFTADASGARIARYARLAGIPTAEISAETGLTTSVAHKDTTGLEPIAAMEAVRLTEDGVLFDAGNGNLTAQARNHRYNSTSAFTLDVTAGEVQAGYSPKLDDQHLTNDVTASRPGGVTIRSVNQASIDDVGYYRDTLEILTTSDNEVQSRADWEVNRFGTPRVTVPEVAVHLSSCSSAKITSLLAADIGTRFTVSNLPAQAPASSQDFFIEGISEDIGPEDYVISFNTSRTEYARVWILDSASYSQLDSTTVLAY